VALEKIIYRVIPSTSELNSMYQKENIRIIDVNMCSASIHSQFFLVCICNKLLVPILNLLTADWNI